ncbi:LOW QUALITY PROTEIN: hypothetical protein BRARA_A02257 [Brassica rapa]|uniref:Protein FAR1-RELATED SEQUENCE n=1 Tax=Brassica campestris TaxID=3711 RepID=A0A398ARK9_BRACM|nr:LOW QUALITY PROTEIN: hypothetical protein BRARA_A02257 [Brassica rapa]
MQVSDETSLLSQNSDEFLVEEKDDILSDDSASVSNDDASIGDFGEEEDIRNNEDYLQIEDVDALEANNENQKKYELYIGMDFSSESLHIKLIESMEAVMVSMRQQTARKNNKLVRMVYVCSKEGLRQEPKVKKSYRPTTRCGCKARMSCYLQSNGRYKIVTFEPNHNHDLVMTPMKHLLKSNRSISISQKQHADDADMSGISAKATVEMMSREVGGRANLAMEKGDAGAVLEYFQKNKEDNASLFYSMQLDEDDMITNIFWADDRSIGDDNLFGDVVCFDTTYKTNEYEKPFAPFVGVNHHKQSIVFGAALLYDETTESFEWLFQTFLGAMSGKQPQTIFTDQCAAMANSIEKVFPETKHKLCVWHIYQNAAKRLSRVFHGPDQFSTDFGKCVYDHENEVEWLSRGYNLLRFFEHYETVLDDRRFKELTADFGMMYTSQVLSAPVEMLQHAVDVYTPEVFTLFQKEYIAIGDYVAKRVNKSEMRSAEYNVSFRGVGRNHLVNYVAVNKTIHCSCMNFSFAGILCRHALKVLAKKDVRRIPPTYILNRWSKEAKARSISFYHSATPNDSVKQSIGKRYSHICRTFREIAYVAAEHIELTLYADEAAFNLLDKLKEKKKEHVKANKWMLPTSNFQLVEE